MVQDIQNRIFYILAYYRTLFGKELLDMADQHENINVHMAYSRTGKKDYVYDVLAAKTELVNSTMDNNGVIYVCGSPTSIISIRETLKKILTTKLEELMMTKRYICEQW